VVLFAQSSLRASGIEVSKETCRVKVKDDVGRRNVDSIARLFMRPSD